MISADIRVEGYSARSWGNLLSLFAPGVLDRVDAPARRSDAAEQPGGSRPVGALLVLLDDEERPVVCLHTHHGRQPLPDPGALSDEPALARRYRARRLFVMRQGALEEVAERLAARVGRGDDYLAQWLAVWQVLRDLSEAGLFRSWPHGGRRIPVPTAGAVQRALDLVLPDGSVFCGVLWEHEEVWTAAVLRRRAGSVDLLAGPDLLARWTGPLGGDWRRDHRVILRAVDREVGPVHLGLFSEAHTVRELLRRGEPGAWARATTVRDVVLSPAPPYVTLALGADAVRGVAAASSRLLGTMQWWEVVSPLLEEVRHRVEEATGLRAVLGFDPLVQLGHWLRARERTGGLEQDDA